MNIVALHRPFNRIVFCIVNVAMNIIKAESLGLKLRKDFFYLHSMINTTVVVGGVYVYE